MLINSLHKVEHEIRLKHFINRYSIQTIYISAKLTILNMDLKKKHFYFSKRERNMQYLKKNYI